MCKGSSSPSAEIFCAHNQSTQVCDTLLLAFLFELSLLTHQMIPTAHLRNAAHVCVTPHRCVIWISGALSCGRHKAAQGEATQTRREFSNKTKNKTKKIVLSLKFLYTIMINCTTGAFRHLQRSLYLVGGEVFLPPGGGVALTDFNRSYACNRPPSYKSGK